MDILEIPDEVQESLEPSGLASRIALYIGRQKVGYEMVVDGFAKFQALKFGISGLEISQRFFLGKTRDFTENFRP